MRFTPRRWGDYLVDVFAIGIAAVLVITTVGVVLDSSLAAPVYRFPVVGQLFDGVRGFWQHVYDPQTV